MSILYCAIPHFAAALARRDDARLSGRPLVLVDPEERVFGCSPEAAACGVAPGLAARAAQVRCPQARFLDADVARCREACEALLQVLERASSRVETHGWGAAYVDLGDLVRGRPDAIAFCGELGRQVRRELGEALQPALGWDSAKFTAQTAARHTRPGRLLAIAPAHERAFLQPLPVALLPLEQEALRRLGFLGLRTLGQYAALPAAVWQQFGRPGRQAHRYARGEDDRPVVPRWQAPCLQATRDLEAPLVERERLLEAAGRLAAPLLAGVRERLQACGQVRLALAFEDGSAQEGTRSFLFPTADEALVGRAVAQLLDRMRWPAAAVALTVTLEQIQDVVLEQLTLFPDESDRERKLREVQRYLAARFGANRLRRAALLRPDAPLPEWRVGWVDEEQP